jgi:hypothetical protein
VIVTNGTNQSFALSVAGVGEIRVRAPGIQVTAYAASRSSVADPAILAAFAAHSGALRAVGEHSELHAAFQEHDISEYGESAVMHASAIRTAGLTHMLTAGDLETPHVQLDVPAPAMDEGVLIMLDDGEMPLLFPPSYFETAGMDVQPRWSLASASKSLASPLGAPKMFSFVIPAGGLLASPARGAGLTALTGADIARRAVLRFFKFKWVDDLVQRAAGKVVAWITERIEKRRKQEGFKAFAPGFPSLTKDEITARLQAGGRALLLVHGIFSSAEASFSTCVENDALHAHLASTYGDRIFAWDHFTVGKGTLQNATEMLAALPPGVSVDVISHSRGAVVTRAAFEHPATASARKFARLSVGKVFFVAGAHRGSALARRTNVDKLLNVFSLASMAGGEGVILSVVIGVLKVLAHAVTDLPGIFDMDPDRSEVLRAINEPGMTPVSKYLAVRANFNYATKLGQRLLDIGADAVFREANDLVVPFGAAIRWDARIESSEPAFISGYGTNAEGQNLVYHTNFFKQPGMVELLMHELRT